MTTPTELSEAHLQDHELISAALEASSLSARPPTSNLPPFLTSAPDRLSTHVQDASDPSRAPTSPTQQSPDLLTTPRTESSRQLSSPPLLPHLPTPTSHDSRNSVKFTLLKKDGPREAIASDVSKTEDRETDERASDASPESDTPSLDPVLLAALKHHRDRFLLLRAEVELERFLANPSMTRLPLAPPYFQPALNSYQRLLVHRLADTFGITREVEAAPPTIWNAGAINPATGQPQGVVVLVKGEETHLPPAKLATYAPAPEGPPSLVPSAIVVPSPSSTPSIASSPITSAGPSASTSSLPNSNDSSSAPSQQPTAPQILKILPRSSASRTASSASSSIGTDDDPATSSSAPASSKGKGRRELTLEEREAAYKEARERIFSQPEQDRSAPALPSSSSVASEDMSSRLASAGAGITRPSSAGSTFSRSSAALSVAGGRPSPSVVSESGSSMWSGHHGGIYGGGSQLLPSLRPSAPNFDPSLAERATWTPEYGGHPPHQDPSWQNQQYFPQHPHPPIQVTAPPSHSPYAASYASSSTSSIPGAVPSPLHFAPHQSQFGHVDAWGRNIPPPLPSPSLSNSSGSSMQRPPTHHSHPSSSSVAASERSASGGSGYLMRFADTGAIVTPGGNAPSPSSSMFVGPPSTTRSASSYSSTSHSLSSGGTSRTAASSSAGGIAGGSSGGRTGSVEHAGPQSRRASGSLAGSISSVRSSGERRTSGADDAERGSDPSPDSKKRDRQTTIRRQSPQARADGPEKEVSTEESSSLHPSLPAKPVWVASRPPQSRSPPPSTQVPSSSSREKIVHAPATTASGPSPPAPNFAPPKTLSPSLAGTASRPQQSSHAANAVSTGYGHANTSFPQGPLASQGTNAQWNRPAGMHYPAAPPFASAHPGAPGQYPIGGNAAGGGGGYGAMQPAPSSWSYAHAPMPPTMPSQVPHHHLHHQNQQQQPQQQPANTRNQADAMPFSDIRRPPPKSTQLFDPNRPSGGMRRGPGAARSVSRTRASLE
ncbi:hypothetical protein JCM3766R1_002367 [Sporobolomyces carnicolor]